MQGAEVPDRTRAGIQVDHKEETMITAEEMAKRLAEMDVTAVNGLIGMYYKRLDEFMREEQGMKLEAEYACKVKKTGRLSIFFLYSMPGTDFYAYGYAISPHPDLNGLEFVKESTFEEALSLLQTLVTLQFAHDSGVELSGDDHRRVYDALLASHGRISSGEE